MSRSQPSSAPHLLDLRSCPPGRIRELLTRARSYADVSYLPSTNTGDLAGRAVALMFFENSTRTRLSFFLAARRLGAEIVDLAAHVSSVAKGETPADTARTIEAMGVDVMVVRSARVGVPHLVARAVGVPVISGGDGTHEHPTQGLLDLYTLAQAADRLDTFDLRGLRIVITGDIRHSRVARSAIAGAAALGAEVACVGPPALAPRSLESLGCRVSHDLDAELPGADAVMVLRVQFERHASAGASRPSESWIREYRAACALTRDRAERLKAHAVVMHPGPMNRGLEIDSEVADSPRSLITRQVQSGVAVRMAALAATVAP